MLPAHLVLQTSFFLPDVSSSEQYFKVLDRNELANNKKRVGLPSRSYVHIFIYMVVSDPKTTNATVVE
jgi:hypothetical protein